MGTERTEVHKHKELGDGNREEWVNNYNLLEWEPGACSTFLLFTCGLVIKNNCAPLNCEEKTLITSME